MKDLLRKTWELFHKHPILWLPYIVVELAAFFVYVLRKSATTQLIRWAETTTTHSVLGGSTDTRFDPLSLQHIELIYHVLYWMQRFLHEFFLVIAFFLVGTLVSRIEEGQDLALASGLASLKSNFRRVFVLSLKAYALFWVTDIWLEILPRAIFGIVYTVNSQRTTLFLTIWGLLVNCGVAWILTPAFLRLLRSPDAAAVSRESLQRARILVLLVIFLRFGISRAAENFVEANFLDDPAHHTFYMSAHWLLPSLAAIFPSILLCIAETLLAREWKHQPEIDAESDPAVIPVE
jgi:hypothetical protein